MTSKTIIKTLKINKTSKKLYVTLYLRERFHIFLKPNV